jgi:hypothetical protein
VADGGCDLARRSLAIVFAPSLEQPWRRVGGGVCGFLGERAAFARTAPQHRVDQADIARRAPVGLCQPHGQIDRSVVRHIHPENLRGAEQQRGFRALRIGRHATIEQARQHEAQRAEATQHGRDQPSHQRAVAVAERLHRRMCGCAVELVVQRASPQQHVVDDVGCDPARGKARRIGRRSEFRLNHKVL